MADNDLAKGLLERMKYKEKAPTCGTCRFNVEKEDQVGSWYNVCSLASGIIEVKINNGGVCPRWEGK